MISCPDIQKSEIRAHYDLTTLFYWLLWGNHIHHGLWDADESPRLAQRQLIDHLFLAAEIASGSQILDVGCGMGGSAISLAGRHDCRVTGLTLSGVQQNWARLSAVWHRVGGRTRFLHQDAESAEFDDASFDVVWSIECTEHLFDKAAFFRRAAGWLRPGGRVAIYAWLAGDEPHSPEATERVQNVCEGFLCPSLGTTADYVGWMTQAGLEVSAVGDLTGKVVRTWEICERRVQRSGVSQLARLFGVNTHRFVNSFRAILEAYETGAMKYGSFVACKSAHPESGLRKPVTGPARGKQRL